MPELPEVETISRELQEIAGRRIVAVEVRWARTVAGADEAAFARRLRGQVITAVSRRGKWLALTLDGGDTLLVHLRMSGRLILEPASTADDPHARVLLTLDDGRRLRFSDPRKFGRMALTADPADVLGALGPEPLDPALTPERFAAMLAARRARLKPLLLDQRFLAGLGNIYADEALWRACLHPLRLASTLSADEAARLLTAIRAVLTQAIERRGTTMDDGGYVSARGLPGDFAGQIAVYGQKGRPCPRCQTPIERIAVGGRGTHFCPRCQSRNA